MPQLESSYNLEQRLKGVQCSSDLKDAIIRFIEANHERCTGSKMSFSNLIYRGNLHYIEDNLNKDGLIAEISKYIEKQNRLTATQATI